MFEKEAEEYRNNNTNYYEWDDFCADDGEAIEEAYKKGAEFGYNKAKEEMLAQGLALQSDMDKTIEQNIQLKAQIEKMKCCENCQKDCGSIDRRICFDNSFKDWELRR